MRYRTSRFSGTCTASLSAALSASAKRLLCDSPRMRPTSSAIGDGGGVVCGAAAVEFMRLDDKTAGSVCPPSILRQPAGRAPGECLLWVELVAEIDADHPRAQRHFRFDELRRGGEGTGVRIAQILPVHFGN